MVKRHLVFSLGSWGIGILGSMSQAINAEDLNTGQWLAAYIYFPELAEEVVATQPSSLLMDCRS